MKGYCILTGYFAEVIWGNELGICHLVAFAEAII